NRPVPALVKRDRLERMIAYADPKSQAFYREIDQELGPAATVGLATEFDDWVYPFFGPRFSRIVVPLVEPGYSERYGLIRPLSLSNQSLLAGYRPAYVAISGPRSGASKLPDVLPGRCYQLPLRSGRPAVPWELWRCDDHDPRNVVVDSDFAASLLGSSTTSGWVIGGPGWLSPESPSATDGTLEPFRARLANSDSSVRASISQEVLVRPDQSGSVFVADARLQAGRARA